MAEKTEKVKTPKVKKEKAPRIKDEPTKFCDYLQAELEKSDFDANEQRRIAGRLAGRYDKRKEFKSVLN